MATTTNTFFCNSCETTFDENDTNSHSTKDSEVICDSCFENDLEHATRIFEVSGSESDVLTYLVGDYVAIDNYGDDLTLDVTRSYIKTDAWRGYHDTTIANTTEITNGADLWGQVTDVREMAERIKEAHSEGLIPLALTIYVIVDLTSNLFATNMKVVVPNEQVDLFNQVMANENI